MKHQNCVWENPEWDTVWPRQNPTSPESIKIRSHLLYLLSPWIISANTQHPLHELSHLIFIACLWGKHHYTIVGISWDVRLRLRLVKSLDHGHRVSQRQSFPTPKPMCFTDSTSVICSYVCLLEPKCSFQVLYSPQGQAPQEHLINVCGLMDLMARST